jgi:sRNA-binding protein
MERAMKTVGIKITNQRNDAVLAEMQRRWPDLYTPGSAKPLAIGIHKQILAKLGDAIGPEELGIVLGRW